MTNRKMYDYVKMVSYSADFRKRLLDSPLLDFYESKSKKTDLVRFEEAEYRNLKIKLFSSGRIQVSGSLHKYWNDGRHNYNDFSLNHVAEVLTSLKQNFGLDPYSLRLENLEYGVNLSLSYDPNEFLDSLVAFKKKTFDNMKVVGPGRGKVVELWQYSLKIYNKSLQYHLPYHVLRYERKVVKMEYISKEPVYLIDLLDVQFAEKCLNDLLLSFDELILTERIDNEQLTLKENDLFIHCSNPKNWDGMTAKQKCVKKPLYELLIEKFGKRKLKRTAYKSVEEKGCKLINCN